MFDREDKVKFEGVHWHGSIIEDLHEDLEHLLHIQHGDDAL